MFYHFIVHATNQQMMFMSKIYYNDVNKIYRATKTYFLITYYIKEMTILYQEVTL